jgi:hypothetical protein
MALAARNVRIEVVDGLHVFRCKAGDLREARDLARRQPDVVSQTDHRLTMCEKDSGALIGSVQMRIDPGTNTVAMAGSAVGVAIACFMPGLLCNARDLALPASRTNPFVQVRMPRWIRRFRRARTSHAFEVQAFGIFHRSRHLPPGAPPGDCMPPMKGRNRHLSCVRHNPSVTGVWRVCYWTRIEPAQLPLTITQASLGNDRSTTRTLFLWSAPRLVETEVTLWPNTSSPGAAQRPTTRF